MMPITTISRVTADQWSCWLAAVDDHAWPEGASNAPNDHSFVCQSQSIKLIAAIVSPLGPPPRSAPASKGALCYRPPQPNPHSAR